MPRRINLSSEAILESFGTQFDIPRNRRSGEMRGTSFPDFKLRLISNSFPGRCQIPERPAAQSHFIRIGKTGTPKTRQRPRRAGALALKGILRFSYA